MVNPLQQSFAANSALLQQRSQQQSQLMQQAQLAVANGAMGGALDSDPSTWTPETAAQQTDRALAKLSTVNPDLAEKLAAQRTGQPADGGGFWGDIKSVLGDVFAPALNVGGKVLEIVGRTSHLVPNVFYDLADGGEFDLGRDIGGALTGEIAHNWHSVIDKALGTQTGMFGAVLGLVGDIATDPLTWLIPAGAGAHLAESAAQGGRLAATEGLAKAVVGKSGEELTAMGLGGIAERVAGRSEAEVTEFLSGQWDAVANAMKGEGRRVGAPMSAAATDAEERAWAVVNATYKGGEAELARQMWEVGDRTARLIQTRTLRTAARDGLWITGRNAEEPLKLVNATDVKSLFEQAVKSGNGSEVYRAAKEAALSQGKTPAEAAIKAKAVQDAAWREGRAFASIAGGTRVKVAVPFTQFRYISSPLFDLSRFTPHAAGQNIARFFSGQSGMNGLVHEIATNGADWNMLRDWMEGGWQKLADTPEYAETLARLRGRGRNLGNFMYSASEKVGGITATLSTGAKASRMGLPAKFAHDAALNADNAKRDFIRGLMARAGYENSHLNPEMEAHFGISLDKAKHTIDSETEWMVAKHLDYFPSGLDTTDPAAVEAWYRDMHPELANLEDQSARVAQGTATQAEMAQVDEALMRHEQIIADMQSVAQGPPGGWSDKQRELLDQVRARWDSAKGEAGKWEAAIGNVKFRLDEALGLHESQVADWRAGVGVNHPVTDGEWYMSGHDAQAHRELLNRGVGEGHLQHTEDGLGVVVHQGKRGPDDVRVAIRGKDYIELDEAGNAQLPSGVKGHDPERTLNDMRKEVHDTVSGIHEQMNGKVGDDFADPEAMARQESEMLTDAMAADRPDARGTYRYTENGSIEATVWDPTDIKRVGEEFPIAGENMGYYPRQLSDEAIRWVNGNVPKDETQILLSEPQIRAEIERKTRGMTLTEADVRTREILEEKARQWNVDADSIPEHLVETNVMAADIKYIDALAHDVGGQILGKAADRMDRLGRIAPFMFGNAPRSQQFEWNVSKGWMKALRGADKELANSVMRLKKAEAKYLDHQQKTLGTAIDKAHELALMMDEAMSGKAGTIDLPDHEMALRKNGETLVATRQHLDAAEAALDAESARHASDMAATKQAEEEYVRILSEPVPAAPAPIEDAAAAEASIKDKLTITSEKDTVQANPADEYRRLKEQVDYYTTGSGKGAKVGNLPEAQAKLDKILEEADPETRRLLKAEDEQRAARESLADTMEKYDAIDQMADQAMEDRWEKRITKAEARMAKADAEMAEATGDVDALKESWHKLQQVADDAQRAVEGANPESKLTVSGKTLAAAKKEQKAAQRAADDAYGKFVQARAKAEEKQVADGAVAAAEANVTLADTVVPDPSYPEAPWAVLDSQGNNVGNYSSKKVAEAAVKARQIDVASVATPEAKTILQQERERLAENVSHITEETGIPARTLPTGEVLPAVNTKGAALDSLERNGGDIPNEVVHYQQTDDIYENGNRKPRNASEGAHYKGTVDPETGRTEGMQAYHDVIVNKGYPKPIEQVYYGADNVSPEGHVWETVDGNHSLELGHQAGHPYVPVVTKDYRTFPHNGTLKEQLEWEQARDWTDPANYVDMTELHPDLFRNPESVLRQKFAQEVDSGSVYLNKKTGSIFNREGQLAGGAGKRVRPVADIERDLAKIEVDRAEVARARQALEEGRRYDAPEAAQEGMRRPGEHRSPAERAQFEVQTQQRRLESAVKKSSKKTEWAQQAAVTGERLRAKLDEAANQANKAYAEAKGVRARLKPSLIKIETAGNMDGLTRLRVPGLEGYAMPSFIAEEWHTVLDHKGPGALAAEWRKWVLGPWKRWATYRWPGFHVRNMYGAWFNNFLGGVDIADYEFAWRVNDFGKKDWANTVMSTKDFYRYKMDALFGEDLHGILTYGQVKEHLSGIGIGSANTRSVLEAANTSDAFATAVSDLSHGEVSKAREGLQFVDGKMRNLGANTEDFHRVAAWGYGMGATGGDTFGARSFVMMRHGDYADLTPAEDHIRDLVPFYKWMRTNIPYQFRMLAENPGKVALVSSKVKNFAYDVQGIDQRQAELGQPEWMRQTMTIPIPSWMPLVGSKGKDGVKYMMADLPYNDLYNGLGDYISAALPVGRNLIESYGFHEQAFTGKPLTGRMNKLSGAFGNPWVGELLSKVPALGVKKGADGSFYIGDRMENVLTAWPIYSRFRNFIEADPDRVQQRLGGFISSVAGVGIREADATQAELDFYYNELEPVLQAYRDMGVTFPNTQDFVRGASQVAPTGLGNIDSNPAFNVG